MHIKGNDVILDSQTEKVQYGIRINILVVNLPKGSIYIFFKRFYLFIFRGEVREKERDRNISVWLPLTCPLPGTWPATQAFA